MILPMPEGPFDVIYADPPWLYANSVGVQGSPEDHYITQPLSWIKGLEVPSAKDAVLYLWATAPLLREGLDVLDAWGFTYKTSAVWDKRREGIGYWYRGQHEHLLVGVKGKWSPPPAALREPSVIYCKRGKHSSKPAQVRDSITRYWPDARRLELFGRYPVPGWTVWGNQAEGDEGALPFEEATA